MTFPPGIGWLRSAAMGFATSSALLGACAGDPVVEPSQSTEPTDSKALVAVNAASALPPPQAFTAEQIETARQALGEAPLQGGASSLDELGQLVVAGLNSGDLEALEALVVTGPEYKERLFSTLANHPSALEFGADASWDMTSRETRDDLRSALQSLGNRNLTFVRIAPPASEERRGLTLHRRPKLVVETPEGEQLDLAVLGSVVEHQATQTFKLLSYRDTPWRSKAPSTPPAGREVAAREE